MHDAPLIFTLVGGIVLAFIFAAIAHLPTGQLTAATLAPILEQAWRTSFAHDDEALANSRPALLRLAQQIARFFGPEAMPQVRSTQS